MFLILTALLLCLAVASVVVVYVAYPHRGEELSGRYRWIGAVLISWRRRLPVLSEQDSDRFMRR